MRQSHDRTVQVTQKYALSQITESLHGPIGQYSDEHFKTHIIYTLVRGEVAMTGCGYNLGR